MRFSQKVQVLFSCSLFFLQMSFYQMIWQKCPYFFPPRFGLVVQVCTGPPSSLKVPAKLRTCCQSVFNTLLGNLEGLHMPRRARGVGKGWHRQALWLMHCLVCPWADSELEGWWEPSFHFIAFFKNHLSAFCSTTCCACFSTREKCLQLQIEHQMLQVINFKGFVIFINVINQIFKMTYMLTFLCCFLRKSESNSTQCSDRNRLYYTDCMKITIQIYYIGLQFCCLKITSFYSHWERYLLDSRWFLEV